MSGMELEAVTGLLEVGHTYSAELRVHGGDRYLDEAQRRVDTELERQVWVRTADGRAYTVVRHRPEHGPGTYRVQALVLLADPAQARVGELVERGAIPAPFELRRYRDAEGRTFERVRGHWVRRA